ncbi:MAG: hypothetical protein GQ580_07745 [Candidatus Thorarchaeota archaeon]|nr:hypothetical protein [Candidatus Thorarchaeota archaeon]
MDLLIGFVVVVGVLIAALFNYILNRAPGSDPEDFQVGPPQLGIKCDCFLNTLIIGSILILALSASSYVFETRTELHIVGFIAFVIITAVGIYGRIMRHHEWRELVEILERAVPKPPDRPYPESFDISIEDEDEEYDRF